MPRRSWHRAKSLSCIFQCVRFILHACACVTFSPAASSTVTGPDINIDRSFFDTRFDTQVQSGFSRSFEYLVCPQRHHPWCLCAESCMLTCFHTACCLCLTRACRKVQLTHQALPAKVSSVRTPLSNHVTAGASPDIHTSCRVCQKILACCLARNMHFAL